MPNTKKAIRLSASQIDTAKTCLRKWYFQSVQKVPRTFDRKMLLGTVTHEVLERYLEEKEMYPKGWTSPTNRFTGRKEPHHITTTEQALVKTLVSKAISENKIRREPDGVVEKEFGKDLGVVAEIEGVKVTLLGFIDYFYGNNIDDHKVTGAPRYYGVTALSRALPMNLYAWAGYVEGWINQPTVWLRYNVFKKDTLKPEIKIAHVEKTQDEINDYYEQHIEPMYKPMVLARKNCDTWEQVDNAMCQGKAESACNKYGGCEFLDICMGKVTLETFKKRFEETNLEDKKAGQSGILDRLKNGKTTSTSPSLGKKEAVMSKGGFLKKMTEEAGGTSPTTAAPASTEKAETPVETGPAPWAFDKCPVCKRNLAEGKTTVRGLSPEGEPCNICVMTTDDAKEANPDQAVLADYDVTVGTDGKVTWTAKAGEVVAEAKVVKEEPSVSETSSQKGDASFPQEELLDDDKKEEPAPDKPPITKAPEASSTASGSLDPNDKEGFNQDRTGNRGFTIAYAPVRSKLKKSSKLGEANCVAQITELSELVGIKLLAIVNTQGAAAETWQSVSYFTRRDMINQNALAIAEMVGNSIIDASNFLEASDEHVICSAIERYAILVIGAAK